MYEEVKNACIYARYSSSNQTEQSIEGQLRVCREFCNRYNRSEEHTSELQSPHD